MSKSDQSLFIYRYHTTIIYFFVYMDDVILTSSNAQVLHHLLNVLCHDFPFKNLGNLHYFLSVQCYRTPTRLILSQQKYITDLLHKIDMSNYKPIRSPISPNQKLSTFDLPSMDDLTLYRSIVGSLQYLLVTWFDLLFAVNCVYQFMHALHVTNHW